MADEMTMDKAGLLAAEEAGFNHLFATFSKLTPAQATAPAMEGGWSVKDNTAHLAAWLDYVTALITDDGRSIIPEDEDEDAANLRIYHENKDRSLNEVVAGLLAARNHWRTVVASLPDAALTDPAYYPWRNGRPLLTRLLGNSSEHYAEHLGYLQPYFEQIAAGEEDEPLPTRAELLQRDAAEFDELERLLAQLTPAQMTAPAMNLGWSVKDNLAHLTYWQRHLITMVEQDGHRLIPEGEEHDVSNARIYVENKDRSLADIQADLRQTHDHYRRLVALLPDVAFTNPRYFGWHKPNWSGLWLFVGNGYEHYAEHIGFLRDYLTRLGID